MANIYDDEHNSTFSPKALYTAVFYKISHENIFANDDYVFPALTKIFWLIMSRFFRNGFKNSVFPKNSKTYTMISTTILFPVNDDYVFPARYQK